MAFFDKIVSRWATPDAVLPLSSNGTANYIYLDANRDTFELDLHREVIKFISREFTKGKFVLKDVPNKQKIDYLLNLKPSENQTANQMMYEFAYGLLKFGKVYYKFYFAPNAKSPTSIEIYSTQPAKQGFKALDYPQLKLINPTTLLNQYEQLIDSLSTKSTSNVLEINTALKADDVRKENETPDGQSLTFQNKTNPRLTAINNQIKKYGGFVTNTNERAVDHAGLTNPDGTALSDLRSLIYEQFHVSPKMLDGSYDEETYRAFYASQLRPLFSAFEELLNRELLDYNAYTSGAQIKIINKIDLLELSVTPVPADPKATITQGLTFIKEDITMDKEDVKQDVEQEAVATIDDVITAINGLSDKLDEVLKAVAPADDNQPDDNAPADDTATQSVTELVKVVQGLEINDVMTSHKVAKLLSQINLTD